MKDNAARENLGVLRLRRGLAYLILIFLTFLSLFAFYILLINATRSHPDIQKGFSFLPGGSLGANFTNLMHNANLPVLSGLMNSLLVASLSAVFATYFSTMTAFGIHAYRFRLNQAAFSFILMVMMVPTQVTALGFVRLMASMGFKDSFIPLTVPAIASPIVFFFMIQYMKSSLPLEVIEAARIDGAGEFYAFNCSPHDEAGNRRAGDFHFRQLVEQLLSAGADSRFQKEADNADPDSAAAQRRFYEIRYGAGLSADCTGDFPSDDRVSLSFQIHRARRRAGQRKGLICFSSKNIKYGTGAPRAGARTGRSAQLARIVLFFVAFPNLPISS